MLTHACHINVLLVQCANVKIPRMLRDYKLGDRK